MCGYVCVCVLEMGVKLARVMSENISREREDRLEGRNETGGERVPVRLPQGVWRRSAIFRSQVFIGGPQPPCVASKDPPDGASSAPRIRTHAL